MLIVASGAAIAAPQAAVDNNAFEYINRTSLSKKLIIEALVEEKIEKRSAELAVSKAEREWGGPAIWDEKAVVSARSAIGSQKLSCKELMSDLVDRWKFTVEQASHGAKVVKVCK